MPNDAAPTPGHFLPTGTDTAPVTGGSPSYAGAPPAGSTPLAPPRMRMGADAAAGRPVLSGSRLGPPPPGDPAAAAYRARYAPDPLPYAPKRRSALVKAGLAVAVLLVLAAGVFGLFRVLSAYDVTPAGTPTEAPTGQAAVTVTHPAPSAQLS